MNKQQFKDRMIKAYSVKYSSNQVYKSYSCNRILEHTISLKARRLYPDIMGINKHLFVTDVMSSSNSHLTIEKQHAKAEPLRLTLMMLFEQYSLTEELYKEY